MFSPERILDRGRILIGMLVIVPLGVLGPAIGGPKADNGPTWGVSAAGPNPLDQGAPTPQDVLARLTNPSVAPPAAPSSREPAAEPAPSEPPSTTAGSAGAPAPPSAGDEVGTEGSGEAGSGQIPGTDLNAVGQGAKETAPPGPAPVAKLTVTAFSAPADAAEIFPVAGGASFTDDWEAKRAGGTPHRGIDLFATSGTPVVAVSDGALFRVGWNPVGGWRLWLRDTWGNEFYYAHLAAFAPGITDGAQVRAGTVLGVVGNSGDAGTASPHLHFEVHPHGGAPVAPFPFVSVWPRV